MAYVVLAVNGLLMILAPLVVGTWLARRYRVDWGLFGAGAATFVGAQLLHVPFNIFVEARFLPELGEGVSLTLIAVALFYGLSAGIFEEGARYVTYRLWRRDARGWAQGLMLGAGHGGVEALILGFIFIINTSVLTGLANGYFLALAPESSLAAIELQAAALLNLPWYQLLLGGVERILTIFVHLALSLIVLRAVAHGAAGWLLAAIGWHTFLNTMALVVARLAGPVEAELTIAVFSLISLWIIYRWRPNDDQEHSEAVRDPEIAAPGPQVAPRDMAEKLENSRYTQ